MDIPGPDAPVFFGRWHGVARADRLCEHCGASALDDERHLVFECSVFEDLRKTSSRTHSLTQLFGSERAFDMRRFFAHRDQRAVVMYI